MDELYYLTEEEVKAMETEHEGEEVNYD